MDTGPEPDLHGLSINCLDSDGCPQTLAKSVADSHRRILDDGLSDCHPLSSEFDSRSNNKCASDNVYLLPWIDDNHSDSGSAGQCDASGVNCDMDGYDNEPLRLSPISAVSSRSTIWVEPQSSLRGVTSKDCSQLQSLAGSGKAKYSYRGWTEWPSAAGTNTLVSDCNNSDPWLLHQKAEIQQKPLSLFEESKPRLCVPVSPAFFIESKPSVVAAGLRNLGNTCFLNAVLQCFTHTVPLIQVILSCDHEAFCVRSNDGFCVLCAFRDQVELSINCTGTISPWDIVENLSYISSSFRRFQQEDAHEFLQCFLDRVDTTCNGLNSKDMRLPPQYKDLVKKVFGGCLVSKVRCCNCDYCSDIYEPLIDLSLEIEEASDLTSALDSFTKVEKIEGPETNFVCESCNEKVPIEKKYILDKVPSIAAFHLKRFKTDGFYVEKIDKYVGFPLELDLVPYTSDISNDNVEFKYDLFAVLVHTGLYSTSGHYYCFMRYSPGVWYKFDDSEVIRVEEDYVLSEEAYILFYAKRNTPWFSTFVETFKSSSGPSLSKTSPKSVLDDARHVCSSLSTTTTSANEATDTSGEIPAETSGGCSEQVKEDSDSSDRMDTLSPLATSEFQDDNSCGDGNTTPSRSPKTKCCQQCTPPSALAETNDIVTPQALSLRSPIPESGREKSPESVFSITCDRIKLMDQVPHKRKLKEDPSDSEGKEAYKQLKRMPNSRVFKLYNILSGSRNKNRSRTEPLQNRYSRRIARRRRNINSRLRA